MDNLKTFEEYRFFKGRKTVPGYNWDKDEYEDVPNKKDSNEPFLNRDKPAYFDKKNKDSEKRKKQWDIDRAKYKIEKEKMEEKVRNFLSTGIFSAENVAEVREEDGFCRSENDYYKFILKDGRKFKYHMSYSFYENLGERADFECAYLKEYDEKGKVLDSWTIYDEKSAEDLADVLKSKMGKYTDKWEFGNDRVEDDED